MNLYSHSEEEEPGPRLTHRPPSPHGSADPPSLRHRRAPGPAPPQPRARSPAAARSPEPGPGRAGPRCAPRLCSLVPVPERLAGLAGTALPLPVPELRGASAAGRPRPAGSEPSRAWPSRARSSRAEPGAQGALRRLKASSHPVGTAAGAGAGFSWLKDLEVAFLQFLGGGRAARRSRGSAPSLLEL